LWPSRRRDLREAPPRGVGRSAGPTLAGNVEVHGAEQDERLDRLLVVDTDGHDVDGLDQISAAWYARPEAPPNIAWSAQSGGVFADDFDPAHAAPEIVAAWDTEETDARRLRARALGRELGATAAQIALAYVLTGPGHPFALAGARDADGIRAAWAALDIALSPDQRSWLERGEA